MHPLSSSLPSPFTVWYRVSFDVPIVVFAVGIIFQVGKGRQNGANVGVLPLKGFPLGTLNGKQRGVT